MVFGRVIRKVEKKLKRPFVFGRYLVETALGSVKDITGEMPFVPEVIASAIDYLRSNNGLKTKGLPFPVLPLPFSSLASPFPFPLSLSLYYPLICSIGSLREN